MTDRSTDESHSLGKRYTTSETPPRLAADLGTPESLARAADEVPQFKNEHRSTGRSVAALYTEILTSAVVVPNATASPAVTAARQLLYADDSQQELSLAYQTYLQRKRSLDEARAQGRRGAAEWTALQTAQPGRIEAALAVLAQHQQQDLTAAFARARAEFAGGRCHGTSGEYYVCSAAPADFWRRARAQAARTPLPAQGSLPWRVALERPWLYLALLSRSGWFVPGRAAGAYSNGRADETNTGLFALLPIAMLVKLKRDGTPMIVGWDNLVLPPFPALDSP